MREFEYTNRATLDYSLKSMDYPCQPLTTRDDRAPGLTFFVSRGDFQRLVISSPVSMADARLRGHDGC
ncbi:MAG: hypothetical protein IPN63_16345 [Gammaproteobacteria bacterium]|nr:hypothetical protein [Gammaproteobacteria bacterium]